MSADRDVTRIVRSWLHEDAYEDADRILNLVLDEVDTTPQRRASWLAWRFSAMNNIVRVGLAAAAVVIIAVVAINLLPGSGGLGGDPTPSPSPSVSPSAAEPTPVGLLPEGPHMILVPGTPQPDSVPLTVTLPADWYGEVGGGILAKNDNNEPPDGAGMIIFVQREYIVYGDACHWQTTLPDTPATTVDEFVAALSSQASRDASEPVDITLDGYAGKSITLEVPADVDFTDCDPGYGGSWDCGGDGMTPCGYHSGPGEIDTVYVLDIDGLIVAWNTKYYAGTPAEHVDELEAIVQSASFGE
ncbi:MAG: hypothetical protein WD402_03725 [Chloroflexota bacterium]